MIANHVGCGFKQAKVNDGGMRIYSLYDPEARYPVLAIEVAYRNESLDVLLAEGSLWLSPDTTTTYCLLIKIWDEPDDFSLEVFLLRRGSTEAQATAARKTSRLKLSCWHQPKTPPK